MPLDAIHLLGPHLVDDVMAAATVGAHRRRRAGGDDRGGRRVPRPRARDGAGRRGRRRAVRQRLEGDQRRVGAAIDRELRRAAWCRSSAAGSRAAICGCCASRCAARAKAVVAIGEARPLVREALADVVPVHEAASFDEAVDARVRAGAAVRRGAARAGVRELRHVPRLRGARTAVQGGGARGSTATA